MAKTKTKQVLPLQRSLETIQDYASDGAKNVVKNTTTAVGQTGIDFLEMLGIENTSSKEKVQPNGEVEVFNAKQKEQPQRQEIRAHIEYHDEIRKLGERQNKAENHQLTKQVQEILAELQRLIKSSKRVEMEFAQFAVVDTPGEVGVYDLNFFEWLMLTIKQAREKVEDSGAWLAAVKGKTSKKGSKKNFINENWKKGNTSVTMSNERNTATSVG